MVPNLRCKLLRIPSIASKKKPNYSALVQSPNEEQLKALSRRRNDLLQMITMESNRMKHPQQIHAKKSINKHIKFMKREIEKIDKDIDRLIANDGIMNAKKLILESIPGVGKVTTFFLLSHMPELGMINTKQISSLLGVAPFDNQSGKFKGQSSIKGGRWQPRKAVYMAAISAIRCNPILKEFYQGLRKNGKCAKVAIVAVMRK